MALTQPTEMIEGRYYLVRYHQQADNGRWLECEMCGQYVGEGLSGRQRFSLRPLFGTTDLPAQSILWVEERPTGTLVFRPRYARMGGSR